MSIGLWKIPECSICYSPLVNDLCVLNTCGHVFHSVCARKWFESKRVKCPCPLCRTTWTLRSQRTLNFQIEPLPLSSDTLNAPTATDVLTTLKNVVEAAQSTFTSLQERLCTAEKQLELSQERESVTAKLLEDALASTVKYKTQRNELSLEANRLRKLNQQLQRKSDDARDQLALIAYLKEPQQDEEFASLLARFEATSDRTLFLSALHHKLREQSSISESREVTKERWKQNAADLKAANDRLVARLRTEEATTAKLRETIGNLKSLLKDLRRGAAQSVTFDAQSLSSTAGVNDTRPAKRFKRFRGNCFPCYPSATDGKAGTTVPTHAVPPVEATFSLQSVPQGISSTEDLSGSEGCCKTSCSNNTPFRAASCLLYNNIVSLNDNASPAATPYSSTKTPKDRLFHTKQIIPTSPKSMSFKSAAAQLPHLMSGSTPPITDTSETATHSPLRSPNVTTDVSELSTAKQDVEITKKEPCVCSAALPPVTSPVTWGDLSLTSPMADVPALESPTRQDDNATLAAPLAKRLGQNRVSSGEKNAYNALLAGQLRMALGIPPPLMTLQTPSPYHTRRSPKKAATTPVSPTPSRTKKKVTVTRVRDIRSFFQS